MVRNIGAVCAQHHAVSSYKLGVQPPLSHMGTATQIQIDEVFITAQSTRARGQTAVFNHIRIFPYVEEVGVRRVGAGDPESTRIRAVDTKRRA